MNKNVRKDILITIFILIVICTILSLSYAFYVLKPDDSDFDIATAADINIPACLNYSITDNKPMTLSGDYALPVKDNMLLQSSSEILNNYKYTFTVTNGCSENISVKLSLAPLLESTMPTDAIKFVLVESGSELPSEGIHLYNVTSKKLSARATSDVKKNKNFDVNMAYELADVSLLQNQSKSYDLYVWIDYYEGDTQKTGKNNNITMNKFFSSIVILSNYANFYDSNEVAFESKGLVSSNISYTDSKAALLNPERGYYTHFAVKIANPATETAKNQLLASAQNIKSEILSNQDTLVVTVFYLTNYTNTDLTSEVLDMLNAYCDFLRQNGLKLIARFAYFGDDNINSDPSNFNQILSHIESLRPFFNTNKDVIHAVQLGFMGQWGEWHNSPYAAKGYRVQILEKALEVIPAETQILVRRPLFYKEYFGNDYFNANLGFSSNAKARVGIYNDGFLSTVNDYGTYETNNREAELEWMDYLTRYALFGGETVYSDSTYSNVTSAINDMTKTHINFLNHAYHPTIIDSWKSSNIPNDIDSLYAGTSAYDYFKNKLGYRFVVTTASIPGYTVGQGDLLYLSFAINNVGFGNLIKHRNVELIIEKDGKYYVNSTTIDPRKWSAGEVTTERLVFKLPGNIDVGSWNVYLRLPDANETLLNNSNYYIKMANSDVWNTALNANYIGTFNVGSNENTTDNGFYQITYDDSKVEDNTPLNTMPRDAIIIDGEITSSREWPDDNMIYSSGNDKVYMYSDEEYLYIYTIGPASIDNIDIRIATNNATSTTGGFDYVTQNGSIYYYNKGYGSWISSITFAKKNCIEEKIPLSILGISSSADIKRLYIVYMTGWNLLYNVDVNISS